MSMIAGLVVVCDLAFYFTILGMARLLMNSSGFMMLVPMIMGVAAGICHLLGGKPGVRRYLPLALIAPCFLIANPGLETLCLVPAVVYTYFYVKGNRRIIDYYFAFTRFRSSFVLMMLVVLFVIFITGEEVWMKTLPYMFLYLVLSINLLRMLRHDAKTLKSWKFRIVNLSSTAAVCAAGVLFSTGTAIRILKWAGEKLWASALKPAVAWIIDAVAWVIKQFHDLVSALPWSYESADMSTPLSNFIEVSYNQPGGEIVENLQQYPWIKNLLIVIGISIGIVIFLSVMKALSNQKERARDNDLGDSREKLEDADDKKSPKMGAFARRKDPVLNVRYYYRKFLQLAKARHQEITPYQNSLQIEDNVAPAFPDGDALRDMRQLYIRARYSSHPVSQEDSARAKSVFDALKNRKSE